MEPSIINQFRAKLIDDPDNQMARRVLHETYEWIEGHLGRAGSNEIDRFCNLYNNYYWNREDIKEIARQFAYHPPVAASGFNFEPTPMIQRATYFLKYRSELDVTQYVDDRELAISNYWRKSSFVALFIIVKQVRDNLFHGNKMDMDEIQYQRNKILVSLASQFTTILLDHLEDANNSNIV